MRLIVHGALVALGAALALLALCAVVFAVLVLT